MQEETQLIIPKHLGFIMDGNRRWARQNGLPKYEGHLAGYNALKDVIAAAIDRGVEYVSFYAFSTENWKRAKEEVSYLMNLMTRMLRADIDEFVKKEIRLRVIGTPEGLPEGVIEAIREAEEKTASLRRGTVGLCFNYGGQREIVDALKRCLDDGLDANRVTEQAITERLYAPDIPPIDMAVRTSGEQRISNFMLWRIAYSELMFLEKFWPDMKAEDIDAIIEEFNHRNRRFGGN